MGIAIQWPLVLFTVIAGLGGGLLVAAGVAQLLGKQHAKAQLASSVLAMVLLVVGGCCSLMHLAAPQNVMAAVLNIFSFSGISVELILLGVSFIVTAVFAALLKRGASEGALKVVAVLGVVAGVLLLFFCGHGYVMPSRPAWDTNMLPLAYLGTSLAGGAFAYAAVLGACRAEAEAIAAFKPAVLVLSAVCAITCVAYAVACIGVASASPLLFWGGVVVVGIAGVESAGLVLYSKADASNVLAIAGVGLIVALIAALAIRVFMWEVSAGYLELFDLASVASMIVL